MYLLSLVENIFLLVDYGIKDELNNMAKEIILHVISKSDDIYVRHCETAKEMLDMFHILC